MIGPSFPAVLTAAAGGDEDAFEVLWHDLQPRLVRYFKLITAAGPKRPVHPAKPSTGRATAARRKRPETATKPSAGRAATTQRKRPVTPAKPSSPRATATGQRRGSRNPSSKSKTRR